MASFDIKSEIDHHEITNAVDQANRILQNRFDFKGTGAEFSLADNQITLSAVEEFQIHQMLPILNESLAKRSVDLKSLKPGEVEVATGSASQIMNLQEGIDKELAKKNNEVVRAYNGLAELGKFAEEQGIDIKKHSRELPENWKDYKC